MKATFKTQIQLADINGDPIELANVVIDAVLYLQGRVRYQFCIGETDAHGRLSVNFDVLEKLRQDNQAFSIMDYNTELHECDSHVSFAVPSLLELQQRQAAMEKWFTENTSRPNVASHSNNANLSCSSIYVDSSEVAEQVLLLCER